MRWYLGYPVLATGLVFAAYVFLPEGADVHRAAPAVKPHHQPVVEIAPANLTLPSRVAQFSPGARLEAPPGLRTISVLDYLTTKIAGLGAEPAHAMPTTARVVSASPWKSAVLRAGAPSYDGTVALTRDIQTELKRVGCYGGDVDGVWGGGSRRAILAFMDRVNASLPTREPDVYILALLRSETGTVCGAGCATGESLTASGRCLPNVIVAQDDARGETRTQAATFEDGAPGGFQIVADTEPPTTPLRPLAERTFEGRMGIGGPKPVDLTDDRDLVVPAPVPARALARTAALETASAGDDRGAVSEPQPAAFAPDSFAPQPTARSKPARSSAPKPQRRYVSSYRHVQHLFEHPLGRM